MQKFLALSALCFSSIVISAQTAQVDPSFDPGEGPNGAVNAVQVLPTGKILVGGAFGTWNGAANRGLVRLNGDGSLDTTFASGLDGGVNRIFFQDSILWVQSNDRLILLQENGAVNSNVPPFQINGQALASGANIFRVWMTPSLKPVVDLYNASGQFQRNLLIGSLGDHPYVMEALPGGAMLLGGGLSHGTQNLELFTPDFDTNFVASAPRGVRRMALGLNSIYVAANNSAASPLTITRLDSSGQPYANFSGPTDNVSAMAVLPDGRLVYGDNDVIRLNLDGSLDASFNPEFSSGANLNALAVQGDGRVLVGGAFTRVDGLERRNIARLLATAAPLPPGLTNNPPGGGGGDGGGNGGGGGDGGGGDGEIPPPATGFIVSGVVTDGEVGIPGVRVKLRKRAVVTDENGAFEFTDVPAGKYKVHATAKFLRIRPAVQRVFVDGDVTDLNFTASAKRR